MRNNNYNIIGTSIIDKRSIFETIILHPAISYNRSVYDMFQVIKYVRISDDKDYEYYELICERWLDNESMVDVYLPNQTIISIGKRLQGTKNCLCDTCSEIDKITGLRKPPIKAGAQDINVPTCRLLTRILKRMYIKKKKYSIMMLGYNKVITKMMCNRHNKILEIINIYINKDIINHIIIPYLY